MIYMAADSVAVTTTHAVLHDRGFKRLQRPHLQFKNSPTVALAEVENHFNGLIRSSLGLAFQ